MKKYYDLYYVYVREQKKRKHIGTKHTPIYQTQNKRQIIYIQVNKKLR